VPIDYAKFIKLIVHVLKSELSLPIISRRLIVWRWPGELQAPDDGRRKWTIKAKRRLGRIATKRAHITSVRFAFNHGRIALTDFTIFIKARNWALARRECARS